MYRSDEDYKQLLEKEMSLTESYLKENPKLYSVWHQRCWVMEQMSELEPDWKKEMSLRKMPKHRDERNCWCMLCLLLSIKCI